MVIDIIFLIVAGYGFLIGFTRGIIKTIFTILSFLFGIIAAFKFAPAATNFLETAFTSTNPMMFLAGFLLAFFFTMLLIRLISRGFEGLLRTANINVINQFLGGMLMATIMVFLYSLLLWFSDKARLIDESSKENSFTYAYIDGFPQAVWGAIDYVSPSVKRFWDESIDFMDRLEEMSVDRTEGDPNIFDIEEEDDPEATID